MRSLSCENQFLLTASFKVKLIIIWKVLQLDSFWNRGRRQLGNGLLLIALEGLIGIIVICQIWLLNFLLSTRTKHWQKRNVFLPSTFNGIKFKHQASNGQTARAKRVWARRDSRLHALSSRVCLAYLNGRACKTGNERYNLFQIWTNPVRAEFSLKSFNRSIFVST